MFKFNSNSAAD